MGLDVVDGPGLPAGSAAAEAAEKARACKSAPEGHPAAKWALVAVLSVLVLASVAGLPYYALPLAERARSPLHPWLKPNGYVGQTAGILAFAMFMFLWLYPIRKRFRSLAFTGSVGSWLEVHVVAGVSVPLAAALHAGWRFTGLIGLGFGAMMVVWVSGLVGRFLYVRIPRRRDGLELTRDEVGTQRDALLSRIAAATGLEPKAIDEMLAPRGKAETGLSPGRLILRMAASDIGRFRAAREFRRRLRQRAGARAALDKRELSLAVRLARREMALEQNLRMLDATHQVFRYWHVAHRPLAISALVAVLIHVGTAIALGVTWFW